MGAERRDCDGNAHSQHSPCSLDLAQSSSGAAKQKNVRGTSGVMRKPKQAGKLPLATSSAAKSNMTRARGRGKSRSSGQVPHGIQGIQEQVRSRWRLHCMRDAAGASRQAAGPMMNHGGLWRERVAARHDPRIWGMGPVLWRIPVEIGGGLGTA